ncbi:MAG TPA: sulfurtransferase FdhD [Deltaproteobacteria bacterium]|nr:sulfurtransferase FdhD [Deltaproteobacteria bacterium]
MKNPVVDTPAVHYEEGRMARTVIPVADEVSLEVFVDDIPVGKIACSGISLDELILGYLKTGGVIESIDNIQTMEIKMSPPQARLITAPAVAGKRVPAPPETSGGTEFTVTAEETITLMDRLLDSSNIHELTRGTHCSALAGVAGIICTREDIGRNNTIDMLIGYSLMNRINSGNCSIVTTGRISAEIVGKMMTGGFPLLISHSAPTSGAITLAERAGITLVGSVRNGGLQVYTHERRVIFEP